jgi:hypothetical protein
MSVHNKLPVEVKWVNGRVKGFHVLIDPPGYRMWLKNSLNDMKFYQHLRKEEYNCPITCTLNHQHDSWLQRWRTFS